MAIIEKLPLKEIDLNINFLDCYLFTICDYCRSIRLGKCAELFYPNYILNSGGSAHIQAGYLASVALENNHSITCL